VTGGFAEAFAARRFGAVLSPLWPVYDDVARRLVEALMPRIIDRGETVAGALHALRRQHADASPTWLAYVLVGDVMGRLVVERPTDGVHP
jgi:hypothetical protein